MTTEREPGWYWVTPQHGSDRPNWWDGKMWESEYASQVRGKPRSVGPRIQPPGSSSETDVERAVKAACEEECVCYECTYPECARAGCVVPKIARAAIAANTLTAPTPPAESQKHIVTVAPTPPARDSCPCGRPPGTGCDRKAGCIQLGAAWTFPQLRAEAKAEQRAADVAERDCLDIALAREKQKIERLEPALANALRIVRAHGLEHYLARSTAEFLEQRGAREMTPSPEALEAASAFLLECREKKRPGQAQWPVTTGHLAEALDAFAARVRAEQHAADVAALRDNMHLFLPIHEGLDVARRIADFLEQRGPK